MKKLFLLTAAFLLSMASFAQSGTCGPNLTWDFNSGTGTLTISGTGEMDNYSYSATDVSPWYDLRSLVTTLVMDNRLTSIGSYAFQGCSKLTSVTIPDNITSIGEGAFYECTGLAGIVIPSGVTSISNNAFMFCSKLASVTMLGSVTSIGISAFQGCSNLPFVTMPESVTNIGFSAFRSCSKLTSINIPSGVTNIGSNAFTGCTSLISVTIPVNAEIGQWAFQNCIGLTSITIPLGVTKIGAYVFEGCSDLTSVDIPISVTSIGGAAFSGCTKLISITIPGSVTEIGANAFYDTAWFNGQPNGCVYINNILYQYKGIMPVNTSITILNGTVGIAQSAFHNYTNLIAVSIPGSVKSIGLSAFGYCSNLTSVIIPDGVTSIGSQAFNNCSKLSSVTIPASVISVGGSAFNNTPWYNNLPAGVVYIGKVLYAYKGTMPANTIITVTDGTVSINASAFSNCTGLISVNIPASVTNIGNSAFSNCTDLTSINISEGVTSIGSSAFFNCSSLSSITIPASVTEIGGVAFRGCSNLNSITNLNPVPQKIVADVFYGLTLSNISLYVPLASVAAYKASDVWKGFNIEGIVIRGCTDCYAENYNPEATENDGSCTYRKIGDEPVDGCMDTASLNYNPLATVEEDAICIYETEEGQSVYGCNDPQALNYNPQATAYEAGHKDCQCVYANEANTFFADNDEEEIVDTISTRAEEENTCQLDQNSPIVSATLEIKDITAVGEEFVVTAEWTITQANGNVANYTSSYLVVESGNTLFYLSIICGNNIQQQSNKASFAPAKGNLTGFTVSAITNVSLVSTGINEVAKKHVPIFPNPISDIVNIGENAEIKIYSPQGKLLLETFGAQIDFSSYPQGVYLLQLNGKMLKAIKK